MSFNKIIVVGNLGRDAELKTVGDGKAVANFSVASTEKVNGESVTTWFRVALFGKQAETISQYLTKGKLVYVEGRLRVREYVDKEGVTKTSVEVYASDIQLLSSKNGAENTVTTTAASSTEDEIPF